MAETPKQTPRDHVLNIMQSKAWYEFNPINHAFNWSTSIHAIAQSLDIDPRATAEAITLAFTPDCLSKVVINDGAQSTPLLQVVINMGITPDIWTVGDPNWQKIKFIRSGAFAIYPQMEAEKHFHCSKKNKHEALDKIIKRLISQGKKQIIVVDDKLQNVEMLSEIYAAKGQNVIGWFMKLNDPQTDATAFYHWLQEQPFNPNEVGLVFDFDGVVVDTDGVLLGPATDNLLRLLA